MNADLPPIIPTDDFWSRQLNAQTHAYEWAPFGVPARITANRPEILDAARLSARRYSAASRIEGQPIRVQIAVGTDGGAPPPSDLPSRLKYIGVGEWIMLSADRWGHGSASLGTRTACLALSRELADDTRLVSRYFIDHYVLNLLLTEWAMLHASCVLDAGRQALIVMIATHNIGKSTTALRLLRAGYAFLADGMALMKQTDSGLIVGGYPVGEVKLRDDVLAWFPEYAGETVRVREDDKTIVDLRAAHPGQVVESLIAPAAIHLCFVERHDGRGTQVAAMDAALALEYLSANTVYWDEAPRLAHNTAVLYHLLRNAHLHRLHIGIDADGIVAAIRRLTD